MKTSEAISWILWAGLLLSAGPGCASLPDSLRGEFSPPDGTRPNNYGMLTDDRSGVRPDVPTIPAGRP